jgi:hypothetical protein
MNHGKEKIPAHRWLVCIALLVLALTFAAKARGEVVIQDSLSRSGGEMRGSIMRVYPAGMDNSIVQLFSDSAGLLATNVITNETLRVLRIWNNAGVPRIDLHPQGSTGMTVRVSSDGVESRMMILQPLSSAPAPVAGGFYRSVSGAFYICPTTAIGWQLMQ